MNNFFVNTRSSIKITGSKIIYFDPLEIEGTPRDADYVFVTHEHFDHYSPEDIKKVIKADTRIVCPNSMLAVMEANTFPVQAVYGMDPYESRDFEGVKCEGIPSYNIGKPFHPKENNWLAYLVELDGKTYFAMGDTDATPEAMKVVADVVFVPIGGKYTMDAAEAAAFIKENKPGLAVPIHYAEEADVETFKKCLMK